MATAVERGRLWLPPRRCPYSGWQQPQGCCARRLAGTFREAFHLHTRFSAQPRGGTHISSIPHLVPDLSSAARHLDSRAGPASCFWKGLLLPLRFYNSVLSGHCVQTEIETWCVCPQHPQGAESGSENGPPHNTYPPGRTRAQFPEECSFTRPLFSGLVSPRP